jgi:hypothetical protein
MTCMTMTGREAPSMDPAEYLGTWELLSELSLYAVGTPPTSGSYVIARDPSGDITLHVSWRMPGDSADRTTRFGGPADGSAVSMTGAPPGGPDAFTLTHVDRRTLDSAALHAGRTVAFARRVVSADGSLLAVVQEVTTPDGRHARNFQVYRRAAGG